MRQVVKLKLSRHSAFREFRIRLADSLRSLLEMPFTRLHWKMVRHAITSQPYDYGWLLDLERDKLSEMLGYFSRSCNRNPGESNNIVKYISLAIRLLDIMREEKPLWTLEGDKELEFTKTDDDTYCLSGTRGNSFYRCLVNVNLRNIARFVPNEEERHNYYEQPHLLYMLKAERLYYSIRSRYTTEWWD